ncbi:MAG TPA: DMT family transporter [Gemmatimonadales bacterium]|nr:DMT family transporter [Gemmatimonadales bacterium]
MNPRFKILAAAVLFSTSGAAIKYLTLDVWQVAGLRGLVAGVALLVMLPEARRGWTWRTFLVGSAFAGATITFALANRLTTAASAIFLQSTSPLFILLLAPVLVGERARRRDLGVMAAMAVGMALFFVGVDRPGRVSHDPVAGDLIALVSALTWALAIIGSRWIGRGSDAPAAVAASAAVGNLLSFVFCLPLGPVLAGLDGGQAGILLYLGIFQLALGYVLISKGLPHVPALEVSLLLLVEPVVSPVWAFLLVREVPGVWSLVGGGIILVATVVNARVADQVVPPAD